MVDFLPFLHFQARHSFSLETPAFPFLFHTGEFSLDINDGELYLEISEKINEDKVDLFHFIS